MEIFKALFSGSNKDYYAEGIAHLQNNDPYSANDKFKKAAAEGNISAAYNLALLNGGGSITPYDIDFAVDCFRQAAAGGHTKAKEFSIWLDKAEDTSFGTTALAMFASKLPADNSPNHLLMMTGCVLYNALCASYESTNKVIEYELDAASASDYNYVHNFIKRTGVPKSVYEGGLNRLEKGSAADQITDGMNNLYASLKHSGHSDHLCIMIRCSIVGYILSKSNEYNTSPMLGIDRFFE
jgi:TPR repeat protein